MENSPEFDGDNTSEVIDEPFPATEASPPLKEDTEVSSPPSAFSTTRRMKNEARFRQAVGEDGSMHKEAQVTRRVRKDGEDEEDSGAKQEKSSSRAKDTIYSTILVSVAVVAVVGAVIAKIALARKVLRGA